MKKEIAKFILLLVVVEFMFLGLMGGFLYLNSVREQHGDDDNLIWKSCQDLGGEMSWLHYVPGCSDQECYLESCFLPKKK